MSNIKYSLFIFLGACSYGVHASIIKLGLKAGFSVPQLNGSQYLIGFLALLCISPFIDRVKMTLKQTMQLLLSGMVLSMTGIFYGLSLDLNSTSLAVILLFQFTWMGILLESIYAKKWPEKEKLISVVFLLAGTLLASNLNSEGIAALRLDGIAYGILSALTFAVFLFSSGRVAKDVPGLQRSIYITLGGMLLILAVFSPTLIESGIRVDGLWKYGILVALFGVILPIVFFAIGSPKVDAGISTIVGAAELPAAIVAAMFILGEKITAIQFAGIGLIMIGIAIPQLMSLKRQKSTLAN